MKCIVCPVGLGVIISGSLTTENVAKIYHDNELGTIFRNGVGMIAQSYAYVIVTFFAVPNVPMLLLA